MSIEVDALDALTGQVVVGLAADGSVWAGTANWIVKDDMASSPDGGAIDGLLSRDYAEPLTAVKHGHEPVFAHTYAGVMRLYQRGDGSTVRLRDSHLSAIETMRTEEDEFGNMSPAKYELRQASGRFAPVGVYEGDDLVALVMPARLINDHLYS